MFASTCSWGTSTYGITLNLTSGAMKLNFQVFFWLVIVPGVLSSHPEAQRLIRAILAW
jgi:hypothetical protein